MAFFINEQCTSCDACRPECPTGSIFPDRPRYVIDADSCRGCKVCVAVCPVSAILELPKLQISVVASPEAENEEL